MSACIYLLLLLLPLPTPYPPACRLGPTCEWDTAAADIIVREAGGAVLQAGACDEKGKPLGDWKVRVHVLVGGGVLMVALLGAPSRPLISPHPLSPQPSSPQCQPSSSALIPALVSHFTFPYTGQYKTLFLRCVLRFTKLKRTKFGWLRSKRSLWGRRLFARNAFAFLTYGR